MNDYKDLRLILGALPVGSTLIAGRGYDKAPYRQWLKVENMFAKPKDWRRIATRYGRCAHTFFSAICIAAAVAFYLN